ncbi:MAG TPA: ABC transporter permease [Vicinamibacterales bacterium]
MALLTWLFRRRTIDRELDAEIRQHFEMAIADRVAAGESPESARLAAINEFGNVLQAKEDARGVWRGDLVASVTDLWQDVRFGVRMLIKNPAFSLVVIVVLSLGIAGNAAIFSLFKGLALKPLPGVRDSSQLAVLLGRTADGRGIGVSIPDYRYIKEHDRAFEDLTASSMIFANVGHGSNAERVVAELVTGNYFQMLGVGAQRGRVLLPSDDLTPEKHPVAVISDSLWRRAFAADESVVGKTIYVNGRPLTVVGVAAAEFNGTVVSMGVDVFAPIMQQPQLSPPNHLESRGVFRMMTLGRLKPGLGVKDASAQAAVLASQLEAEFPVNNFTRRQEVVPIWQSPFGAQTYWLPAIAVLGGMGMLILLIVCANVANLVLVRGASRRGELGVRLALGASRGRLLRLLFVENLVLAIPGAIAGVALASVILPYAASGAASNAPTRVYLDTSLDGYVLTFALLLSCGCAIVFGFVPAIRASRVELTTALNDLSTRMAGRDRLRSVLVVVQVAVSLVLLVGAGLVLRSYAAARHADAGFTATDVTSVSLDLRTAGYDDARGRVAINRLMDSLAEEPIFESESLALNVPMSLVDNGSRAVNIEGYQPRTDEDMMFLYNIVSPDYFRTLRIPLLAGRDFARTDDINAQRAVVINDTLARRFWQSPDQALGKRLRSGTGDWFTVIGVAGDLKYSRLSEPPRPFVYFALLQNYLPEFTIHARTSGDINHAIRRVRDRLHALDPTIPVVRATSLAEQTKVALSVYELAAGSLTVFGVLTILLASIGIYGLVAYSVQQSTREIGIRMAIGARRSDVVWGFLNRAVVITVIGAGIGLVFAGALGGAIRTLLYGVGTLDLLAFGGATAVVMVIALVASLLPAWRASRIDPLGALRHH